MALYLNTNSAYENFKMLANDSFFVDKSDIIEKKADASIQRTGISASQSRAALERHPY